MSSFFVKYLYEPLTSRSSLSMSRSSTHGLSFLNTNALSLRRVPSHFCHIWNLSEKNYVTENIFSILSIKEIDYLLLVVIICLNWWPSFFKRYDALYLYYIYATAVKCSFNYYTYPIGRPFLPKNRRFCVFLNYFKSMRLRMAWNIFKVQGFWNIVYSVRSYS